MSLRVLKAAWVDMVTVGSGPKAARWVWTPGSPAKVAPHLKFGKLWHGTRKLPRLNSEQQVFHCEQA